MKPSSAHLSVLAAALPDGRPPADNGARAERALVHAWRRSGDPVAMLRLYAHTGDRAALVRALCALHRAATETGPFEELVGWLRAVLSRRRAGRGLISALQRWGSGRASSDELLRALRALDEEERRLADAAFESHEPIDVDPEDCCDCSVAMSRAQAVEAMAAEHAPARAIAAVALARPRELRARVVAAARLLKTQALTSARERAVQRLVAVDPNPAALRAAGLDPETFARLGYLAMAERESARAAARAGLELARAIRAVLPAPALAALRPGRPRPVPRQPKRARRAKIA